MANLLLAEDDRALASTLVQWLEYEQHRINHVENGGEALECLLQLEYELAIIDWQMPGMTGVEVCRTYRAKGGLCPIIMLTGKSSIIDKEHGLDSGADDYLTKPFHPRELAARIRALMRRTQPVNNNILEAGSLKLDLERHLILNHGEPVHLQPVELALLTFFMKNKENLFPAEVILRRVWQDDSEASLDAVYTCIRRLRKKLDRKGEDSIIRTVHGVGYGINPAYK